MNENHDERGRFASGQGSAPSRAEFNAMARRMYGVKNVENLTLDEMHDVGNELAQLNKEAKSRPLKINGR